MCVAAQIIDGAAPETCPPLASAFDVELTELSVAYIETCVLTAAFDTVRQYDIYRYTCAKLKVSVSGQKPWTIVGRFDEFLYTLLSSQWKGYEADMCAILLLLRCSFRWYHVLPESDFGQKPWTIVHGLVFTGPKNVLREV